MACLTQGQSERAANQANANDGYVLNHLNQEYRQECREVPSLQGTSNYCCAELVPEL